MKVTGKKVSKYVVKDPNVTQVVIDNASLLEELEDK
jgi:hypothetical protein